MAVFGHPSGAMEHWHAGLDDSVQWVFEHAYGAIASVHGVYMFILTRE
jgi:hypothetical protein